MKCDHVKISKFDISHLCIVMIPLINEVLMMWRSHTKEIQDMLIDRAKIRFEEVGDGTLERPNASFVASSDNILAISIVTFQTPLV